MLSSLLFLVSWNKRCKNINMFNKHCITSRATSRNRAQKRAASSREPLCAIKSFARSAHARRRNVINYTTRILALSFFTRFENVTSSSCLLPCLQTSLTAAREVGDVKFAVMVFPRIMCFFIVVAYDVRINIFGGKGECVYEYFSAALKHWNSLGLAEAKKTALFKGVRLIIILMFICMHYGTEQLDCSTPDAWRMLIGMTLIIIAQHRQVIVVLACFHIELATGTWQRIETVSIISVNRQTLKHSKLKIFTRA